MNIEINGHYFLEIGSVLQGEKDGAGIRDTHPCYVFPFLEKTNLKTKLPKN